MTQLRQIRRRASPVNYVVVWYVVMPGIGAWYYSPHERTWKPSTYTVEQVRGFTVLVGNNFNPKPKDSD